MTDTFNISLTRDEIATIHKALGEHLSFLLKEWEHQESVGETNAAASLFEQADELRTLMNRIGAAPLNLRRASKHWGVPADLDQHGAYG